MSLGKLALTLPAPFLSAPQAVALARRAENEWGYDAAWLAETNGAESFALAGAVAEATNRLEIGTAIVSAFNRTPAILAMATGTLSQLSEGRFILGVGSSSKSIIEDWNGLPFELPLSRVRDTVAVLRQALAGEKTDVEGRTLRSKGFRLGAPPMGAQKIFLAGLRAKMVRLAGEVGDGLIINFQSLAAMKPIREAYAAGAAQAGRDGTGDDVVSRFQVCVTDDVPAARNIVRMAFGAYVAAPVYNRFFDWMGFESVAKNVADAFAAKNRRAVGEAMTDEFIDAVTILGNAEACREKIAAFVEAGVTTPVISPLAVNPEAATRTFEAFRR